MAPPPYAEKYKTPLGFRSFLMADDLLVEKKDHSKSKY